MLAIVRLTIVLGVLAGTAQVRAQESACLKGLKRERENQEAKVIELSKSDKTVTYAKGGSAAVYLACVYKWRSLPGAAACALPAGAILFVSDGYGKDLQAQRELLEDSLVLLQLYEDSKEGRSESVMIRTFMSEHGIDSKDEAVVLKEIELLVDKDMTCNSRNGRPNMNLQKVADYIKTKL